MTVYRIRAATPDDIATMQQIERAAGERFREVGMHQVADDEPPAGTVLLRYIRSGRALIMTADTEPVAYLVHSPVDGDWLIGQVSVHPHHARLGLGRALIDRLAADAVAAGAPGLSLTTFEDVPWNAPYYARCGFVPMPPDVWGPDLAEIRRLEREAGLDQRPRVCMRRPLTVPPGDAAIGAGTI